MAVASVAIPSFAFVFVVIWFIVLKNKFRRFYQPKTVLVPKWELMKPLPSGLFRWVHTIIKISDQTVIEKCGYDAYFFLRSIQMVFLRVFFWPLIIVLPVHHSGGLPAYKFDWQDIISTKKYWNHLILAIVYITYLCWVFSSELRLYSERRRAYFCSPLSRIRPSATTILVTGIPKNWFKKKTILERKKILENLFNDAVESEGRVQKIVINRNFDLLNQSARETEDIARKLEERTTKMIRVNNLYPQDPPYLPTHRRLIFFGKKIDTIDWYWKELADFKNDIPFGQTWFCEFDQLDSAFITFDTQIAAQVACSSKIRGAPWKMRRKVVSPDDIIWDNLSVGLVARYVRTAGYMAAFPLALVVFAAPLDYIKLLVNENPVSAKSESRFSAVYQDLGPPFFVFVLVSVLPFMIRVLAKERGVHTGKEMELSFHRFCFAAQFIQVFVFRVMGGVTGDPLRYSVKFDAKSIRKLIESIWDPNTSTYFILYTIIQVLAVCGVGLLQLPNFLPWVLFAVMNDTPRNRWVRWTTIREVIWGWLFPFYTTLACIGGGLLSTKYFSPSRGRLRLVVTLVLGLIYSMTRPLIMIVTMVGFFLAWFVYRYSFLYATEFRFDTGGLHFPTVINHLFTGVYLMEICLAGLFLLVRDQNGKAVCKTQAIIMIISVVATVGWQIWLNKRLPSDYEILRKADVEGHREDARADDWRKQSPNLPPETRDQLVERAFVHPALRAKRPVIWIPRDVPRDPRITGFSDDEVWKRRMWKYARITNVGAEMDGLGRIILSRSPPGSSEEDLLHV